MGEAFIVRRGGASDVGAEIELVGSGFDLGGGTKVIPELAGCKGFHIAIYEIGHDYEGPNNFIYSLTYVDGTAVATIRTGTDTATENPSMVVSKRGNTFFDSFDEKTGTITLKTGYVFALPKGSTYDVYKIK